ncbi:Na/Pi cotransporter family protein [Feifania hominis]|uniref:Na/Pi cotransporter family protein n=1 Tax=Feifania hominis TaxID=2763660 RepID=A0A926DFS9_9FIRM|nr:Na/Pi cotransporter family protein [Feifania hominis]MBC8537056.1 Na/Pi cotransporter family protein [Feifania hominis]
MKPSDFLGLLGGLALFLYGMQMMSGGLEAAAGNRMKRILERLTANRILGVLVGAGITAVIQSSSATTVMVVGFVNSGLMTLQQAIWIIMGANIGTTVTGLLIALDVGALAPLIAFVGVVMVVFIKGRKIHHYGEIIAGLGVLFIGMEMMSSAMEPLRDSQAFIDLLTRFQNPLLGVLVGMLFTAIIQSSSASIGILQALARSGLIGLSSSVFVLFGMNIGTCVTAVLASIGTSRAAKRTTIVHLLFNVFGTGVFVAICSLTPFVPFVASLLPASPAGQIAAVHTTFNIVTTLLLLPFGTALAKLATAILPERKSDKVSEYHLQYVDTQFLRKDASIGTVAIAVSQLSREIGRMAGMAYENVDQSFALVERRSDELLARVNYTENYIDYLNKELSQYISRVLSVEMPPRDAQVVNSYFKIAGDLERIGDHALNIGGYADLLKNKGISLSEHAMAEVRQMRMVSGDAVAALCAGANTGHLGLLEQLSKAEQKIDDLTAEFRQNQVERMRTGECSGEACVIYSEMLTDFERIGDHALNIAQEYAKIGAAVTD